MKITPKHHLPAPGEAATARHHRLLTTTAITVEQAEPANLPSGATPAAQPRPGPGAGRGRRPGKPERTARSPEPQATEAHGAGDACPPARASGRDRAFRTPPRTTTASRLPRLLAVSEVAQLLKVSSKTTRRWIEGGELRVHHLGRQLRVSEEDLATFLNRRRT
jgi:excisionase family DNA binding protein